MCDVDAALNLLGPYFAEVSLSQVEYAEADPDMNSLREDPRFKTMVAGAKARHAAAGEAVSR